MAGRRWFARNAVASLGWWCLIIFAIGGCCGVLAADSVAMEPNAAVARGEEGGCYRPLSDVIWGFLVTLFALTISLWGSWKHRSLNPAENAAHAYGMILVGNITAHACATIVTGVLTPLEDLAQIVDDSLRCVSLLWICHKMEYPDSRFQSCSWLKFFCSSLFPWSKSPVRILASCDIVVYVSKESPLLQKIWLWRSTCHVKDESEAMVVGENGTRAIRNDQYERKQLSGKGVELLVWKEVFFEAEDCKRLPKYDELKYLRGNSGFAVIAIAVQAFGYVYAIAYRFAKNLRVSPVEVIGLVFNIILLIKAFFYSTCNRCYRPLVIYMDRDWEHEVGEFDENNQMKFKSYDLAKVVVVIFSVINLGLSTLLLYCIVNIIRATNTMVALPAIFFLLGFWLDLLGSSILEVAQNNKHRGGFSIIIAGGLMNAIAYIWAVVGTILYWRTMHFNTQADFIDFSQIIPFIG